MRKNKQRLLNSSFVIRHSYEGGYIALVSILVITAVALAVSVSISLLGVGEAKSSLDYKRGQKTIKIAESCVEESLLRLKNDDTYTGGSLSVGIGSCTTSISGAGADWTIDVSAQITDLAQYTKKLQVTAKRAGNSINLVSWEEVE